MSRYRPEEIVTQPLLDRLFDLNPDEKADAPITRLESVRRLKTALKRDMEWLLNTRHCPVMDELEGDPGELKRSLLNYGLPDISSMSVQSGRDNNRILRQMEEAVEIFEPRLRNVRVTLSPVAKGARTLRFAIEALLMMDPAPEQVRFDTLLELTSGDIEVRGDSGA
ncbi:MAG: type VI secretion system baseplate subunit TssE [Bryobacterales bacterium]|nr:type VI secretion system baseplate subunit TssE [Bryobacterales bacterium]